MTAPVLDVMQPETAASLAPDLATDATALSTRLANVSIATEDDAAAAVGNRQQIADLRKTVVDYFAPIKSMAYQLHRKICDRENAIVAPLDARDRDLRDALAAFVRQQQRDRINREQAESDRRRREDEATALAEAATLESAGLPEIAAAVVEDAIAAPPPVVTVPARVVPGLKTRRVWKWKYQGTAADRERVLALIPRQFLAVDEVKINSYVRAMKSSGSIPGIEIYSVDEPVR